MPAKTAPGPEGPGLHRTAILQRALRKAEYVGKIQAVSAADLQRAADQYLQTNKFAVLVVGDLAKIEQPIRGANLGSVKVLSVDEIIK